MIIVRIQNQNISVAVLTHDVIIVDDAYCSTSEQALTNSMHEELFALISSLWHFFLAFWFCLLVLPFGFPMDFAVWFSLLVLPFGFASSSICILLPLKKAELSSV